MRPRRLVSLLRPVPTVTTPSPAETVGIVNENNTPVLSARHTETAPNRSLPTIKLDAYDGSTPLQTHLSKLSTCASYYNLGPDDRLCHLKTSLVGQAGEVLWQLTDDSTGADVVRLLKTVLAQTTKQNGTDSNYKATDVNMANRYKASIMMFADFWL